MPWALDVCVRGGGIGTWECPIDLDLQLAVTERGRGVRVAAAAVGQPGRSTGCTSNTVGARGCTLGVAEATGDCNLVRSDGAKIRVTPHESMGHDEDSQSMNAFESSGLTR
jgi:hypothetical protein